MRWQPTLDLAPSRDVPAFLRVARAVIADVERGRLRPGDRLPGSRSLARELGLSRSTITAALAELDAQGWTSSSPREGVFVARELPDTARHGARARAPSFPPLAELPFEPGAPRMPRGTFLSAGMPDPRLLPGRELARAFRRAAVRAPERVFSYGPPEGDPALRREIAAMVSALRGVPVEADGVLVTRGSQMALYLAALAFVRPGDRVAVEAFGYSPAWHALRLAGATLVPIPVDDEGVSVDALAEAGPLRAVYVTPHHQYPTTVTLSPARRVALLEQSRRRDVVVLEDDYDHEFHYEGRPVLPLASAGRAPVVYVGTLSKVLAPGLRLGFAIAPPSVVRRMAELRTVIDRQGDAALEAGVAELFEDGEVARHVRKMRIEYARRRDALAASLVRDLGSVVSFALPPGGISIWASIAGDVPLGPWLERARERGVDVASGGAYAFDGRERRRIRLVFSRYTPRELAAAVRVLAAALPGRGSRRG